MYWYLNTTVTASAGDPWHGMTGFGWDFNLTKNLQVFAGIGFGLRDVDYNYNPRAGVVWRF